jgi:hypothetical protein
MPNFPTFFFSHARQDREMPGKYLRCFFEDLESRLAQWAGVVDAKLGTIDSRVKHGDDWDKELSRGLSENRVFLAIISPLYFNRPNCGKELAVFLQRSRGLGINPNGALTGVENVLMIRWLPESAYAANAVKDSLIPPILGLVADTPPADADRDEEQTQAIERYKKKGMERCVRVEPHYSELLSQFVARICALPDLPPLRGVSFATAPDAFRDDWKKLIEKNRIDAGGAGAVVARPDTSAVRPHALSSVVAFYVTYRQFTPTPVAVDFADQVILEALPDALTPIDPGLAALLDDCSCGWHCRGARSLPCSN